MFTGVTMTIINTLLPFISSVLSFLFAFLILKRYWEHRGLHHLLWGIGMVFYGIGGFCEAYNGALGWNPLVFRLWYLSFNLWNRSKSIILYRPHIK